MTYSEINIFADILLVSGALGAGLYCHVLAKRLRKFTDLKQGVGGAVAVMAVQANDLQKALNSAQSAASVSVETLADVNSRAEAAAQKLELLIASLHGLPDAVETKPPQGSPFYVRETTRADQ